MPLAHIERRVLQDTRNETDLVRGMRRQESVRSTAEVMQAHGFAELRSDPGTNNVVNPSCRKGAAFAGCPEPVMVTAPHEVRSNRIQIVREVREDCFRHAEALLPFGFGVLRIENNARAGLVELKMSIYGQRCDAAPPNAPEAEQDENEAVATGSSKAARVNDRFPATKRTTPGKMNFLS
jgi:hypothetical protein